MKNRASSHLLIILLLFLLEIAGYWAIHRSGLLRGYETSTIGAVRDLMMFVPLFALVIWLSRVMNYSGQWILFTTAVLLVFLGMLVQYRLSSEHRHTAER